MSSPFIQLRLHDETVSAIAYPSAAQRVSLARTVCDIWHLLRPAVLKSRMLETSFNFAAQVYMLRADATKNGSVPHHTAPHRTTPFTAPRCASLLLKTR